MGPLVPAPICQSVMVWKASPLGSGRKKRLLSSRGGGGVGATCLSSPSRPQSIRAQGDWGSGSEGRAGGTKRFPSRQRKKCTKTTAQSLNSRFRTAHRRCRPQTPIPSSPGTQGSSSHPGLRSHSRRVRVQGLLLLGIRGWVFP